MSHAVTIQEILTFLLDTPLFGDLDPAELSQIVHIMQLQKVREGQYLVREGEVGEAWYVVYEGRVEVVKDGPFERTVLAELGPKQCFGEMAILDGSPRFASVRALNDGAVFRFPRLDFNALLEDQNLAAYKLIHRIALVLVARQRETTQRLAELLVQAEVDVRPELAPILSRSAVTE
jgi:CRP/FNR family cyclic AMP-dependent transcriptional regulator